MTPEQEGKLDRFLETARSQEGKLDRFVEAAHIAALAVADIRAACVPCAKTVENHDLILRGPPGNGTRPGLVSRVNEIHSSQDKIRETLVTQTKWSQRQLAAIIIAFLAAMAAIVNNLLNGGTFP